MGKKLNSRQQCASNVAGNVAGDVAGDKSLATGVHFCFGPCTFAILIREGECGEFGSFDLESHDV